MLDRRYDLSVSYPGRWLDPALSYHPYLAHSYVLDGSIQMPWPMAWILPSAILYAALSGPGLMVLPVAGGALAAWSAGRLADRVAPGAGWLGISLAGLATPMLIFSTLFYEHAAAAGLFSAGLLLMPLDGRLRSGRDWLLAGLCFDL